MGEKKCPGSSALDTKCRSAMSILTAAACLSFDHSSGIGVLREEAEILVFELSMGAQKDVLILRVPVVQTTESSTNHFCCDGFWT